MTTTTRRNAETVIALSGLEREDTGWLGRVRKQASAWVEERGFPTRKDEDWKYVELRRMLAIPYELADGSETTPSLSRINETSTDLVGPRLVFVNGRFVEELSRMTPLPDGIEVTNLASVLIKEPDRVEPFIGQSFGQHDHAFTALNTALFEDGAFVSIADDVSMDEAIELVFFNQSGEAPIVCSPRSVIVIGENAGATIIETFASDDDAPSLTNAVAQVVIGQNARLLHLKVQDQSETSFHLSLLDVKQAKNSHLSSSSVTLGSAIARDEVRVRLEAEHAELELSGLYMPHGNQHHDNPVLVEHCAPSCTSHQLFKGIVADHGHGVFNGRIVVEPGAFGTDAGQINKNLLLSDDAEVDTRPRLEILADDVKVSHGAAVGRLDEDAIFYLRTRGVPSAAARTLLTRAFTNEIVETFGSDLLQIKIEALIAKRLASGEEAAK